MKTYMVSYDLIKRKDYPDLISALQKYNYWHCLGSQWFIKSDENSQQIFNKLKLHIDADDKLIVCLVQRDAAWTTSFPKNCQEWLKNYL